MMTGYEELTVDKMPLFFFFFLFYLPVRLSCQGTHGFTKWNRLSTEAEGTKKRQRLLF